MERRQAVGQGFKACGLILLFVLLAFLFYFFDLGGLIYVVLVFCSAAFLAFELFFDASGKSVRRAALAGVFLLVFDFAVESAGGVTGLWATYGSVFPVGFVPVEIMFVCFLGGTAWALYLPKAFNPGFSVFDVLFFSFFGSLGESLLIRNGVMAYSGGWTAFHAFLGYAFTWMILHVLRYKVLEV
jgi:hypothetical protein